MKILKNKKLFQAFTLVELIIVITILAILATVAFVSFSWYSASSRDANRLTTLKNIEKWLGIFQVQTGKLPFPENAITLLSSWVTIWYQWEIWEKTAQLLKFSNTPVDVWDKNFFTYSTNLNRNLFQVGWYLEKPQTTFLQKTYASNLDYSKRYFTSVGSQLWILLVNTWSEINKPLQKLRNETSFTGIELKTFTWTLPNWVNVWELKVVFDTNPANDMVGTGSTLVKIESSFTQKIRLIMPWTCTNWWTEVGKLSNWSTNLWDGIVFDQDYKICEGDLSHRVKTIVPETCNGLTDLWNLPVRSTNVWDSIVFDQVYKICEGNIIMWIKTLIPERCWVWWTEVGKLSNWSTNVWDSIVFDQVYKICQKN